MLRSLDERRFEADVLGASGPTLVNFWAPWCGVCRLVTPLLEHYQQHHGDAVRIINVNADENLLLARRYRLSSLPTILLLHNGQLVRRWEGFLSREALKAELDACLDRLVLTQAV
jgi:thioredoxin 1